MKTLVVCDSNFGNTKLIALEIAKTIGDGAKVILTKDFKETDLKGVDLLIFGSPIIGWRPSETTLKALESLKGKIKKELKFATFDTRVKLFIHGDAKEKMAEMLHGAGGKRVFESQAFYVKGKQGPLFPGELEKAANWAKLIKSKM
jgi:flavodoxin